MKHVNMIFIAILFLLFGFGVYGFYHIAERWVAALWQYYKFYGYGEDRGISLGQNLILYFLSISLFVVLLIEVVSILKITSDDVINRVFFYIKLLYIFNAFLLVLLPISGLVYIYQGR